MQTKSCDILLAGGGLSGLTLALELGRRAAFRGKSIVLIDRDAKQKNDRTWCFWAAAGEPLPPVLYHSWPRCQFYAPHFSSDMDIAPFRYHMIRGVDYYRWALGELDKSTNIKRVQAQIDHIDAQTGRVHTNAGVYQGAVVCNSAFTKVPVLPPASAHYAGPPLSAGREIPASGRPFILLLQHFKGWWIETPTPVFDPAEMTFMDFRIDQHGETRFMYVLPFSETRALVEFTVFSPELLAPEAYDCEIQTYLRRFLKLSRYAVQEEEFGVIPMTNFPFPATPEGRVIHIGTAGGFVKASSGFAFLRTQRKIRAFADAWERSGEPDPRLLRSPRAFRAFDHIFLDVLYRQNALGATIFKNLFQKLPASLVLRFLDEDASFSECLRLVGAPPALPFLRAFLRQLPNLRRI